MSGVFPAAGEWARAVAHSVAHPRHILGPYDGDDGAVHMDCMGCEFDTGPRRDEDKRPVTARCDLCGMPAELRGGVWEHAEPADSVFCALFNPRARGVGSGGAE